MSAPVVAEAPADAQLIAEQPAIASGTQTAVPLQGIQPPTGLNLSSKGKARIGQAIIKEL